jgi:hypothetical protein
MLKKLILTIFSLLLPMIALADELRLSQDAPISYVVKKGDTLWDISGVFLQQPWLWPKLWRINPDIENPHLIYPGDKLSLVFDQQGIPMLVKNTETQYKTKPVLRWSPKIRSQIKEQSPVSTLSLNAISPYIKYDHVLADNQFAELPYVLGNQDGYKSSVDGFKTYVKGDLTIGQSYAIYQKGEKIIDLETQENVGRNIILVGIAEAITSGDIVNNQPATLYISSTKREIRAGDVVMPVNDGQLLPAYFSMQAADDAVRGAIIQSTNQARKFAKFDVVMLNLGNNDNIKQGDVFSAKRKSPGIVEGGNGPVYKAEASYWDRMSNVQRSDYNMPEETLGKLMVFKVYDKVSMALILQSEKPLKLLDVVTAP